MKIKVSVIMPSLNVAAYIEECMESVLCQSLREIEVICVDGGSCDGTYEILKSYEQKDSRVRLLSSNIKSYGRQVNMGLEVAKGEYIAVVETDDYIAPEMYNVMYRTAADRNADYVKADFSEFSFLKNGHKLFEEVRLLKECRVLYGKTVVPSEQLFLFERDYNIWSGIYSRNFLKIRNIRLQETEGAAFQDIGFMQQVLCSAQRAVYLPESCYRYRTDRETASSYSPDGLKFACQEFQWFLDVCGFREKLDGQRKRGVYRRMVRIFLWECTKAAECKSRSRQVIDHSVYYDWFHKEIKKAIDLKIIEKKDFETEVWSELKLLLLSEKSFADYKKVRQGVLLEAEQEMLEAAKEKQVVIFGCGNYGNQVYRLFLEHKRKIAAFCDNDSSKWGNYTGDIEIISLNNCISQYPDAYYIIANKYHGDEIKTQLLQAGIKGTQMIRFL